MGQMRPPCCASASAAAARPLTTTSVPTATPACKQLNAAPPQFAQLEIVKRCRLRVSAHDAVLCAGRSWRFGERDFSVLGRDFPAELPPVVGTSWGSLYMKFRDYITAMTGSISASTLAFFSTPVALSTEPECRAHHVQPAAGAFLWQYLMVPVAMHR
jgi:hypothetical protein